MFLTIQMLDILISIYENEEIETKGLCQIQM